MKEIGIHNDWKKFIKPFLQTESWLGLYSFVKNEYAEHSIYPKQEDLFNAFNLTKVDEVRVVIIGQDPYYNPNQAHGLSFSVPNNVAIPPSLRNIYREIESDLNIKKDFTQGNLTPWSKQGVLLLNSVLTV